MIHCGSQCYVFRGAAHASSGFAFLICSRKIDASLYRIRVHTTFLHHVLVSGLELELVQVNRAIQGYKVIEPREAVKPEWL